MSTLDIELTAACDRLRIAIRNEQQVMENAKKWRSMANTSTIQRRIKNEVKVLSNDVSLNRR